MQSFAENKKTHSNHRKSTLNQQELTFKTRLMILKNSSLIYLLITAITFAGCQTEDNFSTSTVLSAKKAIKKMEVEEGFKVELVASEPLLNSPTTMIFDEKGRIWLTEMQSYMLDTAGTGEEEPTGKVIILDDKNKDGVYESQTVFMDGLVLPRALCLIDNGILIAEPPYLWFVEIENDKPGAKILVDKEYAIGGNVEHQPNGLLRGLDNWIYNAKSDKRYRKVGDEWVIEKTHYRGQWGIAQDNYGRLYYNHNSANVLGDHLLPSLGTNNKNQNRVSGYNETIVGNNRVYPARPTVAVNRGYMEGILDDSLRLANFTAASALTIYRGDLFGEEYDFNAFVPEPAAYLIKRNILSESKGRIEGKQAYENKEFIRSTDERFRPVSLSNGPDGALYIVDMYRGIIQHKTYLTDYLKNEIVARSLENPNAVGRIYRVVPKNKKREMTSFPEDATGLVALLGHPNGWVRDKAQQLILDKKMHNAIPELHALIKNHNPIQALASIHALWTLEGLGALSSADILPLFNHSDWHVKVQALTAASSIINTENYHDFIPGLEQLMETEDIQVGPYLGYLIQKLNDFDQSTSSKLTDKLLITFPQNKMVSAAIISGLENKEDLFLNRLAKQGINSDFQIQKDLTNLLKEIAKRKDDINTKAATKKYPQGALIYNSTCATCHGKDGYGIESLAPTLNKSDWVTGNKNKLIATVLFGLTGPITVNGITPDVTGDMPGVGQNREFSDDDIAQVISFIRNAWSNNATSVDVEDIIKIRNQFKYREKAFTMKEINTLIK